MAGRFPGTVASSSSESSDLASSNSDSFKRPYSPSASPPPAPPPPLKKAKLSQRRTLNYRSGMFLAPMVRIGTVTTRLLSLHYGAELVWGPEIVDKAIIGAERRVNSKSGLIEYVKVGPKAIWDTHPIEKSRLIYQIGSSDPDLALKAAQIVADDVSGIDLNCGCPKPFSVKGGMGAALLKDPDRLCAILTKLVTNMPTMPISAKIRLLPEEDATLALVSRIIATGISNLTVHCRTQDMRSTSAALLYRLRAIVDHVHALTDGRVSVVANGDCWGVEDVDKIIQATGVTSVMVARGAEANPSCFRKEGREDPETQVMPLFVKTALALGQHFANGKYCLAAMDPKAGRPTAGSANDKDARTALVTKVQKAKDWHQMAEIFGIDVVEARQSNVEGLLPTLKAFGEVGADSGGPKAVAEEPATMGRGVRRVLVERLTGTDREADIGVDETGAKLAGA